MLNLSIGEGERERESHLCIDTLIYEAIDTLNFREWNFGVPEPQELNKSSKRLTKLQILNLSIVEGSS
jgi:hypothetical protein